MRSALQPSVAPFPPLHCVQVDTRHLRNQRREYGAHHPIDKYFSTAGGFCAFSVKRSGRGARHEYQAL